MKISKCATKIVILLSNWENLCLADQRKFNYCLLSKYKEKEHENISNGREVPEKVRTDREITIVQFHSL